MCTINWLLPLFSREGNYIEKRRHVFTYYDLVMLGIDKGS